MNKIIGIRREDKNKWERRVPLVPEHVRELRETHGIRTIIQPSSIRIFPDDAYRAAGADVREDLDAADLVLAVKEIPIPLYRPGKTYFFFSHVIKGQPYNMPMLKHIMEMKCQLLDYEKVIDDHNRRLIFFGRYAGLAGMIDTLHGLGRKLKRLGLETPLERIRMSYQYDSLEQAKSEISAIGQEIDAKGLPAELAPLTVGFSGYGNVSRGAQEIFDLLPHKVMSAQAMVDNAENFTGDTLNLYKVVFAEEDMVRPREGRFDLQDYYTHPEKYVSRFEEYLPHLTALINCIYWEERYPRLLTKEYLKSRTALESNLKLQIVGDISCDIDGSIEITSKATKPDNAFFTYFAANDRFVDGIERLGVSVMAVDNLPCEFSAESSHEFSKVLAPYVPQILAADMNRDTADVDLPSPLKRALILHKGELTPDFRYMTSFIR
jgi:saccharopine dehydrogenase (NAD+, L-lysine forming)